ncbi:hypothetical protein GSO32_004232 [Salmonella enterica]|nr:hypothetical protein [Salmonella enterica subsp. enterica serovar Pomona]EEJ8361082.1 hypothetical protein [Salmonella enterica]HAK8849664.1 hypothetical protein [Salmonella enterica]
MRFVLAAIATVSFCYFFKTFKYTQYFFSQRLLAVDILNDPSIYIHYRRHKGTFLPRNLSGQRFAALVNRQSVFLAKINIHN